MLPHRQEEDSILDLSKTSSIKQEPIREEYSPLFIPQQHFRQILAANPYWRVPPLQSQYVLDLSHATKTDDDSASYRSSSTSSTPELESIIDAKKQRLNQPSVKDDSYFERRRKNNLAAKKSRDAKRKREAEAKAQLIILRDENRRLKNVVEQWKKYASKCCCPVDTQLLCETFECDTR